MALLRSSALVGGFTMASRLLGFARDILIANALGTGPVADAFFIAFRLPNLFRRLVGEGAFSAAFVPLLSRALAERGRAAALAFAGEALALLLAFLVALTALALAAMPSVIAALAPGFTGDAAKFALAVAFARITFPYLLFIALVALLADLLNALFRFAAAAAAPALLNIVLIAVLLLPHRWVPSAGHGLAWGVVMGGGVQFLWLAWACGRNRALPRLPRPRLTPGMRRLLRLMVPGAVGAGMLQINMLVGTVIASLLPTGAVSLIYYAERVYQLPLGVVGAALGTVLLPEISRKLRLGDGAGVQQSQNRGLELALLVTLPAAAGLIALAHPITVVLFERGAFDAEAARATAATLAGFALGLPAYVTIKVLSPAFFAREDTVTPVKAGLLALLANGILGFLLAWPFGAPGIALGTALAAWGNVAALAWWLKRAGHIRLDRAFRRRLPRMFLATLGMTGALLLAVPALRGALAAGPVLRAAALAALVLGGLACFAGLALAFKAVEPSELRRRFGGKPA